MDNKVNIEKKKLNTDIETSQIIYQDKHLIIINKKAGQLVSPPKSDFPSISSYLKEILKNLDQFESPESAGIVHRLDKNTSGLLVCAKMPTSEFFLKEEFKKRRVKKIYHAIIKGHLYQAQGQLDFPIGRTKNPFKRKVVSSDQGKSALTEYRVLNRNNDMTLVEIKLHTGRTHQIRVHFSYIGHPVLGDRLYGETTRKDLFLCSKSLGFFHPHSKKWMEFKIDYPSFFASLVTIMETSKIV